ncbi:MAG TPA: FtsX-like permease family protein, partial [bacterium]|nr:FtsX-like permease family protein [bacterium]
TVSGTTSSGIAEIDDLSVTMSLADAQGLVDVRTVPDLVVFLRDIRLADAVARRISSAPAGSATAGLTVRTWQQLSPSFQQANSLYQLILGVARLIVLVVALFSISGTLSVSVLERYREIGTLRAFGTRRRQVLVMLVVEGLLLGAAGAALGYLAGAGMSALINVLGGVRMPPEPGMSTAGITIRFTPQAADLVGNVLWLLAAAAAAALVPALLSQRRPAAELLRAK